MRTVCILTLLVVAATATATTPHFRAGEPLAGLTDDQLERFLFGQHQYGRQFTVSEGLGPTINNTSCGKCHAQPLGGWGEQRVTRFGFMDEDGNFSPTDPLGDTLWQHVGVTGVEDCREVIPDEANHAALRVTTGMTGYGLIEAILGDDILAVQLSQDEAIRGEVRWVQSSDDPPDAPKRVGRFGWKAQEARMIAFSAGAASAEMGITTWLVPTESPPNGDWDLLAACDDVPDPETGVDIEGFDYLSAITDFQRFMAPPPRIPRQGVLAPMGGEVIFENIGCVQCHVTSFMTPDDPSLEPVLRDQLIEPYSDFLLHDMGQAGDGIRDGEAGETWIRTSPLWGLALQPAQWHDGRCGIGTIVDRIHCAIEAHDAKGSQAQVAALSFAALSAESQAQVIEFLSSLGRRPFDTDRDGVVRRNDLLREDTGFLACLGSFPSAEEPCTVHDHDSDGMVDVHDLDVIPMAYDDLFTDCNGNGQWDLRDIALAFSEDFNGDGVPDECETCPGDLDLDGDVDVDDLLGLISVEWGCHEFCLADLDESGTVDSTDVLMLIAFWGDC